MHPIRYQSRLPPLFDPRSLFNTPGTGPSTPGARVNPQLNPNVPASRAVAQPRQPEMTHREDPGPNLPQLDTTIVFLTPPLGHFSNPMDNMLAAATRLAAIPIEGESPAAMETRNVVELLQTVVA